MENMVAGYVYSLSQQTSVRLFHWREKDDDIDLVYDHPESPMAFEISISQNHHRRGLFTFSERYPRFQNKCFLIAPNVPASMPAASINSIGSFPLDLFLLAVSAQAERELENNLMSINRQA